MKEETKVGLIQILLTVGIVAITITIAVIIAYPILPIPSGSVTGELVSVEVHPMGDFCGDYAWTMVKLKNYTGTGELIDCWNYQTTAEGTYLVDRFYFDGEYTEVEDLTIGNTYEFVYKTGSRMSDVTSSESITQFYLLHINEVK